MIIKLPPSGTEIVPGSKSLFARSWYDFFISLKQQIESITGGGGGIPPETITVSQSDVVLGRSSPGAGAVEELTFTDQAQQLADDTSFAEMRTTLGIDAAVTPYTPGVPGDWSTVPDDVAQALDLLAAVPPSAFDVDTILTDGDEVLVDSDGNVLIEA